MLSADEQIYRWMLVIFTVLSFGMSGYFRRKARRKGKSTNRLDEDRYLVVLRILIAFPLYTGLLVYMIDPGWMNWSVISIPAWLRWTGVGFVMITPPGVYWVMSNIGENISETILTHQDHKLVMKGPYRCIRHPLYTVGFLYLTGATLITASWFIGIIVIALYLFLRFMVIPIEEEQLLNTFGEDYQAYLNATGCLVPRFIDKEPVTD